MAMEGDASVMADGRRICEASFLCWSANMAEGWRMGKGGLVGGADDQPKYSGSRIPTPGYQRQYQNLCFEA